MRDTQFPSLADIRKARIDGLRKYCPSAIPYITYADREGEPVEERLFNWREGFQHVFHMLISEREARDKAMDALRQKDEAMGVLFDRMKSAGVDYSDLIP